MNPNASSLPVKAWRTVRSALPGPLLNLARFVYSPGYRMGRRDAAKRAKIATLAEPLLSATQGTVFTGPFRGMKYIRRSTGSALAPKILGTYEKELHAVVEEILARSPSCLIDIGAAEGFYAVGFALRLPRCRIIAFEGDPEGREMLRELATLNGVAGRIEIRGFCQEAELEACLKDAPTDAVVICDTEGAEFTLMDPARHPELARRELLIEVHHWTRPGLMDTLKARFQPFGAVSVVTASERTAMEFPGDLRTAFNNKEKRLSMDELRPPGMQWLRLVPANAPNAGGQQ